MRIPLKRIMIGAAAGVLIATVAVYAGRADRSEFTGTTYAPPEPAPAFELIDHTGRTVTLADYAGTALLVFFGYTHCPDVCPLTLQKLSRVLADVDADPADLRVLLVTVDPARDTPAVLADYVSRFGPHVTGLSGDPATLARMRNAYGVHATPAAPSGALPPADHGAHDHDAPTSPVDFSHTPMVLGIDRHGDLRVILPMHAEDEVVARDIERLLSL